MENESKSPHEEIPLFLHWIEFIPWLFHTTGRFPKAMRFTLTNRIDSLALDIQEKIVEACYSRNKKEILREMDLLLERLRVLLRIAYKMKFVNIKAYDYAINQMMIAGKQIGGWKKQQEKEK